MHRTNEELRAEIANIEETLPWIQREDNRIHLLAKLGDLRDRLAWQLHVDSTFI